MKFYQIKVLNIQVIMWILFSMTDQVSCIYCHGNLCPMYSYCSPINNTCMCSEISSPQEEHCGSDGNTYSSLQSLQTTACQRNITIISEKKGPCYKCGDPNCHFYSRCDENTNMCRCKPVLEIYGPVCGSDGKTYDSVYQLNHTSCTEDRDIQMLYSGFCQGPGVCGDASCHKHSICDRVTNKCSCKISVNITADYVCGTDGKSYINEESMNATSCHENRTLDIAYAGKCNVTVPDECKSCHRHSICDFGQLKCVCMKWTNRTKDQVCGDDGQTYWNKEKLNVVSCQLNKNIQVVHGGKCMVTSSLGISTKDENTWLYLVYTLIIILKYYFTN